MKLDLRNLTPAHLDEALPHIGKCHYASPCIIGTLIPADQRTRFDNQNDELDSDDISSSPSIEALSRHEFIEFPDVQQEHLAQKLQSAFDGGIVSEFLSVWYDVQDKLHA